MIVPRERFRIDTVSASYLASLGFPSVRPRPLSVIGIFTKVFGMKRVFGLAI